jgi:DNA-binding NarL/FixJ family response regulator
MRVLVVTPDAAISRVITERLSRSAAVDVCSSFPLARRRLSRHYDLLITELRLGEFNGLQLVHLVGHQALPTRCVVFGTSEDPSLTAEVTEAGAYYEHSHHIAAAAPAYLRGAFPATDRRDPASFDGYLPADIEGTESDSTGYGPRHKPGQTWDGSRYSRH